jgi:hypothetical protein
MGRLLLATVIVGFVLAGGSAYADQNANGSIEVSPSTAAAGSVVHISGSVSTIGCPKEDSAIVVGDAALFAPDGFGPEAARDSQGALALDYTVPDSTPAGTYQIGLRCGGGNVGVSATLRVTLAPAGASSRGTSNPVSALATNPAGAARRASPQWLLLEFGGLAVASALVALGLRTRRRAA